MHHRVYRVTVRYLCPTPRHSLNFKSFISIDGIYRISYPLFGVDIVVFACIWRESTICKHVVSPCPSPIREDCLTAQLFWVADHEEFNIIPFGHPCTFNGMSPRLGSGTWKPMLSLKLNASSRKRDASELIWCSHELVWLNICPYHSGKHPRLLP